MKRSTITGWTILAIIAIATFATSLSAHALGTRTIQFGSPVDNSGNILLDDAAADLLAASNASAVRLNFKNPWNTDTPAFYSTYDTIVDRLRSRGLEVIGLMSNEFLVDPQAADQQVKWQENAAETTSGGDGHNGYIDAFGYQAARVAAHFLGRVHYWEIWNEPNCYATYPTGCSYIYPSNFAALLAHVWTQMRYYNSFDVEIISGGLLGHDLAGKTSGGAGADYLTQTYQKGIDTASGDWAWIKQNAGQYPLDHIGQHIYIDGGSTVAASSVQQYLDWIRNAYVAFEGGSTPKKTFVTEIGWRSDGVGEPGQATNLTTAYSVTESTSYVATAAWFFLRDEPAWPEPWGLLRTDSSAKPAWAAFGGGCIGCGGGGGQIPLVNAGIESNSSGQYGYITGWGPSGGWAYHSGFPKGNNSGLGASFGFYSAGTTEIVAQILTERFQAGTSYTFRSWAIGGGNNTGTVPYQIGYASTDGVLGSFVPLATNPIPLTGNTAWVLTQGVTHITGSSGPEIGKQIIVRLGDGSAGGSNDIWFDDFELTSQ